MHIPLLLTWLRLGASVVVGAVLVLGSGMPFQITFAAALFIAAALTDYLDGYLARTWHQVTALGAFLDPLADKLLVYLSFIFLTVVGVYPVWLLLVVFTRDIVTDGFRAFSIGRGIAMPANVIGKWKSFFQMTSIGLLLVLVSMTELQFSSLLSLPLFEQAFRLSFWLMVAAAVVGIVSTIQYFVQYGSKLFTTKKKSRR